MNWFKWDGKITYIQKSRSCTEDDMFIFFLNSSIVRNKLYNV